VPSLLGKPPLTWTLESVCAELEPPGCIGQAPPRVDTVLGLSLMNLQVGGHWLFVRDGPEAGF
jgi:hypothetical protein